MYQVVSIEWNLFEYSQYIHSNQQLKFPTNGHEELRNNTAENIPNV